MRCRHFQSRDGPVVTADHRRVYSGFSTPKTVFCEGLHKYSDNSQKSRTFSENIRKVCSFKFMKNNFSQKFSEILGSFSVDITCDI